MNKVFSIVFIVLLYLSALSNLYVYFLHKDWYSLYVAGFLLIGGIALQYKTIKHGSFF